MDYSRLRQLKKIAINIRKDCINTQIIAKSGHIGGSFSIVELLVYLYFENMNIDPEDSMKKDRDIFILSKGHASLGYYSVLASRGFFSVEELTTYRQINSRLQGHTHIDEAPGVECSTGSLGQGLSYGLGVALGCKKRELTNRVYVMLGDGEIEEGQIWEAMMLQGYLKIDNLIPIIDFNKLQLDDRCDNIIGPANLKEKLLAFGFNVIQINGHDFEAIEDAFKNRIKIGVANIIIADTIKGKGISFMENEIVWHSKKIDNKEYKISLEELLKQEVELND